MTLLVFDIETVPDVESGRILHNLPEDLSAEEAAKAMVLLNNRQSDFLPHYLQQVVAISVVAATDEWVKVWSVGELHSEEPELLNRFFQGIDKYVPTLVSWNGSGFDLPVLHYRALKHDVCAPTYWEMGEVRQDFKWNNYHNRYHFRHVDVMDVLAGFSNQAKAPLDAIACMLGFPGKMGMKGDKVWANYLAGDLEGIRNYCETDVLNTYLVYLQFECMRGHLSSEGLKTHHRRLQEYLCSQDKPHLQQFCDTWQKSTT